MNPRHLTVVAVLLLAAVACGGEDGGTTSFTNNSTFPDTGTGGSDAEAPDTGSPDTDQADAPPTDAASDSSPDDTSEADTGEEPDVADTSEADTVEEDTGDDTSEADTGEQDTGEMDTADPNEPPEVFWDVPEDGARLRQGSPVEVEFSVRDDRDLDALVVTLESDLDGSLSDALEGPSRAGRVTGEVELSVGAHTLTAAVTDTDGATTTASVTVVIEANFAPEVEFLDPEEGAQISVGAPGVFRVRISDDRDPDEVEVRLESDRDGELTASEGAAPRTWEAPLAALSVGAHVVTATATDGEGGVGTATLNVTVVANAPPTVVFDAPAPDAEYTVGEAFFIRFTVGDDTDSPTALVVALESDRDGAVDLTGAGPTPSGQVFVEVDDLSIGTHTLTATATDSQEQTTTATLAVTIAPENDPPSLSVIEPELRLDGQPVEVAFPDPLDIDVRLSDDLDSPAELTLVVTSSLDGPLMVTEPNLQGFVASRVVLSPGEHTLQFTVTDSLGAQDTATRRVDVAGLEATITFDQGVGEGDARRPTTRSVLTAAFARELAEPVTWRWSAGDREVQGAALPSEETSRDEVWTATGAVTVAGVEVSAVASVTIANTPPRVAGVRVAPTEASLVDTLECLYDTWEDPDGDDPAPEIAWLLVEDGGQGGEVILGEEATLDVELAGLEAGDRVVCRVTAFDGTDRGNVESSANEATIVNEPPTIFRTTVRVVGGGEPVPTATFECEASGVFDPEGETPTLTLVWTVEGEVLAEGEIFEAGGALEEGDALTCTATATDSGGAVGTNADTVIIRAPLPARPIFKTAQAYAGDLGGVTGADRICADEAQAAGLPGPVRALLSTPRHDAIDRVEAFTFTQTGEGGAVIATNKADLFNGSIAAAIDRDASGNPVPGGQVWTATDEGGVGLGATCGGWTRAEAGLTAGVGATGALDGAWLASDEAPCDAAAHIYCVGVGPDQDGDGLTDAEELFLGTAVDQADSDNDRLPDGVEVWEIGSDPTLEDTDGGGALDGDEVDLGTDPTIDGADDDIVNARRVFVTVNEYPGDLAGLEGADVLCNFEAQGAGLPEVYAAVLSTNAVDARDRLVDGTFIQATSLEVIATSVDDLIDGALSAAPSLGPSGEDRAAASVWTGSTATGTVADDTCSGWSSSNSIFSGAFGAAGSTDGGWLAADVGLCITRRAIYCVEVADR